MTRPGDPDPPPDTREGLMRLHAAARARRDSSDLGSDGFRDAAEEVARIEVAIAAIEEPPAEPPSDVADAEAGSQAAARPPTRS